MPHNSDISLHSTAGKKPDNGSFQNKKTFNRKYHGFKCASDMSHNNNHLCAAKQTLCIFKELQALQKSIN